MCGIYGYVSFDGSFSPEDRIKKLRLLLHRGPDNIGFYHEKNVFMGHSRLSILDLTAAANQPFNNSQSCLIYNGEVYNYLELRQRYFREKHFLTTSDTEVLFKLLKEYGTECLCLLNGMFALGFYDKVKNQIILARDTVGIKPLYYIDGENSFEFSSEIKSLSHVHCPIALKEVLLNGHFEEGHLPYENVRELSPGHLLQLDLKTRHIRIKPFAQLKDKIEEARFRHLSQAVDVVDQLDALLQNSISLHLQSDAPLGCLCSGGVDSSLISAMALKQRQDLKLYHAGVAGGGGEERFVEVVSAKLDIPVEYVKMNREEYWNLFPLVTYSLDLPIYHPNDMSLYSIARKARSDGMKVLLCGEGADELFGGYPWHQYFRSILVRYDRSQIKNNILDRIVSKMIGSIAYNQGFLTFSKNDFVNHAAIGIGYSRHNCEWLIRGASLFAQDFMAWKRWMETLGSYEGLTEENDAYVLAFILNNMHGHLGSILHRTDRILMANSIEGRVPFLENSLFDFALNLPLVHKIEGNEGKSILKKLATRYLPHRVAYRKKEGFPVPWQHYLPDTPSLLGDGFVSDWTGLSGKDLSTWYSGDPLMLFRLISIEVWGRIFVWNQKPEEIKLI